MRVIGSMGCPQCDGTIDILSDDMGGAYLDYRDCQHDNPFERDIISDYEERKRFEGLEHLQGFEHEARKHPLYIIGEVLLGTVGEANHSSWDGMERSQLEAWNQVLGELKFWLEDRAKNPELYADRKGWGFGDGVWWDVKGERHED